MVLKFYYDLMSQPARALYMFLKINQVPYVDCKVALRKAEHLTDKYAEEVNPFRKVPVIDHDGFTLTESVAILRYLSLNFRDNVANNWYPADPKKQARVDEFLEWQHLNIRAGGSMYFRSKFILPILLKQEVKESTVAKYAEMLEKSLDEMDTIWLKNGKKYLCGDTITVADLIGTCEVEQPRSVGYAVFEGRPNLESWLNRVKGDLNPHYDDAHTYIYKVKQALPK